MNKFTTLIAAAILSACTATAPVFAAEEACTETYDSVVVWAAEEGFGLIETDDVAGALTVVESIYGPAPDDIKASERVVGLTADGTPTGVIGFIDSTGCVIGALEVPIEAAIFIFE